MTARSGIPLATAALLVWAAALPVLAFELANQTRAAGLFVPSGEPECVRLAAQDLAGDTKAITGQAPALVPGANDAGVVLVSLSQPESAAVLTHLAPGFGDALRGKWEAYRVETVSGKLIICGSDERGTMFGLYDFIEQYLDVDPLGAWTSRPPPKRPSLSWENVKLESTGPSFRFRGWFINDEDLLTEWKDCAGKRRIDYPYYSQVISREIIRAIAESLVRSRCNLIIPASFVDILNPQEEALIQECARRGVFVSQHHVEPLGVSAFSYFNYWKQRGRDLKYSYFSHPAEVREVWTVYARKWAAYPHVIWQLGLRGIADRPMWMADPNTPQSDADRGRLISEAMAAQVKILDEVCPRQPRYLSTTLWAEGSALNQQGLLSIPDGTIAVFADNSPGWKWQADFHSTPRNPKNSYGVYYHHALIGSGPHLAQVPSPRQTFDCLKAAADKGAGTYAIFNVSNIREFVLGMDASAKMTWDIRQFNPDAWFTDWVRTRFPSRACEIRRAYQAYFDAWQIHPEQQVPFLMDGQMFSAGNSILSQLAKWIKTGTPFASKPDKAPSRPPGDAFWSALSDTQPRPLSRAETSRRIEAQREGLERALHLAQSASATLPSSEAAFLRDNLIYPSAIMISTCEWLKELLVAAETADQGDRSACAKALGRAESAFAQLPVLAESYCHDGWTNWYRGCKKLDIAATLQRTRDVWQQAQKAP